MRCSISWRPGRRRRAPRAARARTGRPRRRPRAAFQLVALGDDHDREVLAAGVPALDLLAGVLDRDRVLGDQDHVRAAGDAADDGDPARVPAHHLEHHHAVVRLGGRVQPVDRLGADVDGGVEAEGVVGAREVVVDRLRDADDGEVVLGVQPRRDAERVLAADRDERVEALALEALEHGVDAAVELVRVRARGAEDRAAARQQARDLAAAERLEDPVDEPAPALAHADHLVPARERPPRDRADDRVQPGAVAAAGEDSDLHAAILRGAEGGNRTHTGLAPHRILSPARLPVPPLRLVAKSNAAGGGGLVLLVVVLCGYYGFICDLRRVCQFRHFGSHQE